MKKIEGIPTLRDALVLTQCTGVEIAYFFFSSTFFSGAGAAGVVFISPSFLAGAFFAAFFSAGFFAAFFSVFLAGFFSSFAGAGAAGVAGVAFSGGFVGSPAMDRPAKDTATTTARSNVASFRIFDSPPSGWTLETYRPKEFPKAQV